MIVLRAKFFIKRKPEVDGCAGVLLQAGIMMVWQRDASQLLKG